jgi:hypothetical protein
MTPTKYLVQFKYATCLNYTDLKQREIFLTYNESNTKYSYL